ncbi:Hypothetical predicted protein [Paramuricea clavata]|uniref:Uncharacterized protein n=1 Tax=Paramuricea clavata TaxID=317549 RepID=A0A6S7I581_PARCT|nr:Hypothetical predicted protein [Paramuricea clavata]
MLFKVLLCLCLLQVMVSARQSGFWRKIASDKCVGARNNHYKEFTYTGPHTFIIAMKMVHKKGRIGCVDSAYTRWGCSNSHPINIIVTDTRNKRIYPSPTLISTHTGGWYDLPGYEANSPELVFSDPGFRYLYKRQKMRIWYGEDLHNYTEGDNHGFTCMDVYVYSPNF